MPELKLKDLRYLVALADTRHFGRAAAKCFVSQPTLSAQLRKLEQNLGVQLIERQPRRVTLTPAGEEVTRHARHMLETGEAILTLAQTRRDPLAGQLRLALLPTIGPYLLPQVALKLRKALPRLELMLYELSLIHIYDVAVALDAAKGLDLYAARARDASEIIARQVHQHDVLGILLGIGAQFRFELRIERGVFVPRPRTGDRAQLRAATVELDQRLGRGADDGKRCLLYTSRCV